ncbi:MAG: hypothetical protein PHU25_00055 [Deltaproteobacteria bacterium]|nr:hypothetical protein [Deltaproteobacteria bacterium]
MKNLAWMGALLAAVLAAAGCTGDDDGAGTETDTGTDTGTASDGDADGDADSDADTDSDSDTETASDMGSATSVVFLHHSTGGVIWDGGVAAWIDAYNTANAKTYAVTQRAYPDTPYPWENYPYDYWNIWVRNAGSAPFNGQDTLEILTAAYDVIVFKHCFPVSGVGPDTGSPDIASPNKTQENYKLQYAALKEKLHEFPDTRFIVWTGAALRQSETDAESAARAKAFFDWVKNEWDEPGDNIFVWDFRQLETDGGLYLTEEHASTDSHPNTTFAAEVAPLFGRRLADVIEGRGDTGSLTGED